VDHSNRDDPTPPGPVRRRAPERDLPDEPLSPELRSISRRAAAGAALSHDIDHLSLAEHVADGHLVRIVGNALRKHLGRGFSPFRALRAVGQGLAVFVGRDAWAGSVGTCLGAERRAG